MTYITGFISAVPAEKRAIYEQFARKTLHMFKEFGATRFMEAWEDDVPDGKLTDMRKAVDAKPGEVIVYSWQEYPDKAASDAAEKRMSDDPRMAEMGASMPFDARRMIYGGFHGVSEHGKAGKPGYVDGSIIPVTTARKEDYRQLLERQAAIFTELGATRFVDAWGDNVPDGKLTDFKRAVQAKDDETVVFSFIEWPSKAVRDAAWPKIYEDPRMQEEGPGDEGRRIFGGFVPLVDE